jgi:cytochrome c biogenesis protein CcmG, thiol:disulfide interchange protein DsbE
VVLVAALVACGGGGSSAGTLPALTLRPLEEGGTELELAELTGPAVLNLWATWCAPCRKELPAFQEVSDDRPGVRFIGVDIAEDASTAQDYLDELGVTFEQFLDARGELADALGTAALPVTVVIGPDGRIATEHVGPMTADDLDETLDDVTG